MPKIAFVGLGAMGSAMVKRLLAAGIPSPATTERARKL